MDKKKYNLDVVEESLLEIICLSKLFVTSYGSNVLQYATICKIKSIVLNFFKDKNLNN